MGTILKEITENREKNQLSANILTPVKSWIKNSSKIEIVQTLNTSSHLLLSTLLRTSWQWK